MPEKVAIASEQNLSSGAIWRYRFALLLIGATFLLIVAGGNVTSKAAGLSVPDWPTSFGSVNPPGWLQDKVHGWNTPGVRAEHGHRLIGAAVGILVLVLAGWLWQSEKRAWVRWLAYVAVVMVIVQGVMGGLRVTQISRDLAILHGCLAQMFLCLTVALAMVLAPGWQRLVSESEGKPRDPRLQAWTVLLVIMLFVQLILGTILRQVASNEAAIWHIAGSIAVGVILAKAARPVLARPESEGLQRPIITLMVLYTLQMVLGMASYLLRLQMGGPVPQTFAQTYVRTVHMAVGAIILGLAFYLAMRAWAASGRATSAPAGPVNEVAA